MPDRIPRQAPDLALPEPVSGRLPRMGPLSDEQVEAFWRDGYVVMDDAVSPEDLADLKDLADLAILVPSEVTSHIQECHIACIHMICEIIERKNHARV